MRNATLAELCGQYHKAVVDSGVPVPVEVLHHLLGSKDEQHVLATAAAAARKLFATAPRLKTSIHVAQNDR